MGKRGVNTVPPNGIGSTSLRFSSARAGRWFVHDRDRFRSTQYKCTPVAECSRLARAGCMLASPGGESSSLVYIIALRGVKALRLGSPGRLGQWSFEFPTVSSPR